MVVVGAGRIGLALKQRSDAASLPCALVDRASGPRALDGPAGVPVVLAVRNDDLLDVIGGVPVHRLQDLVFVQNGALRAFVAELGLAASTRGVLYLWVAARGEPVAAARTSLFCGPHAEAVTRWFEALELPARTVDWPRFSVAELEKLLWLAVNGLLCEGHGATVGEVAHLHREDHDALVAELAPVGRAVWGVDPERGWLVGRLLEWSHAIPEYRASVKELRWRNGWLREQARRYGLKTPLHDLWMERTGHPG
jgi:hypothetical protein